MPRSGTVVREQRNGCVGVTSTINKMCLSDTVCFLNLKSKILVDLHDSTLCNRDARSE